MLDAGDVIVLSLTSRMLPSTVDTLSPREFWTLDRRASLLDIAGQDASDIAHDLSISTLEGDRIATLLERRTALALAAEQMEHAGTWTITGASKLYPATLRRRLGDVAPPVLHGLGDPALLLASGVGIVGSRDLGPDTAETARAVADAAVGAGRTVISGGARGVDQAAMNAAFEAGGRVVGILADSLERSATRVSTRQAITQGLICLVTPYSPRAGFTPGGAMGRNKLIYAMADLVIVVRSSEGSGGTWAGATEALRHSWSTVLSWTGSGSGPGNQALVGHGARAVSSLDDVRHQLAQGPKPTEELSVPTSDQLTFPI